MLVSCADNALKGNDSVDIKGCVLTLISTVGDGIKTTNSSISDKGNQRGTVSISEGADVTVYAACDGIDAAYDAIVDGEETKLSIYTDKYSNYSKEVTAVEEDVYYIRYKSQSYKYSVKYTSSQSGAVEWVDAEYHSKTTGGKTTYYYYSFKKLSGYDKLQVFVYSSSMAQGQETSYSSKTDLITPNTSYDTIALSTSSYSWTNYTTTVQSGGMGGPGGPGGFGPGGMMDGNNDKGDHSTKGIKAANQIVISNGTINIKSYDDAIHAKSEGKLESGASPLGDLNINGGVLTLYSNDDGLHADGKTSISKGTVSIQNSYEGIEGTTVSISGGYVSVIAKDDGINATTSAGVAITISGGDIYIYCTGDGIDSNSKASYSGIVFSGGNTVVISNSNGNSALDTEAGYKYTGGYVIAIMPKGGMTNETIHTQSFNSIGKSANTALSNGCYLTVKINETTATVKMPCAIQSAYVVVLGSSTAALSTSDTSSVTTNSNGVAWN